MKKILISLSLMAAVAFAGCHKSETDTSGTDTPDSESSVTITIVEPTLEDATTTSYDYTATINGEEMEVDGLTITLPADMAAASYTLYVYNTPETIEIENTTSADGGDIIATVVSDGEYLASPDENLLFGSLTFTYEEGVDAAHTLTLSPLLYNLNYEIDLGDTAVSSLSATIDGLTQQWDCINDTTYCDGEGSILIDMVESSVVSLTRSQAKYKGSVLILGINPKSAKSVVIEGVTTDNESFTITDDLAEIFEELFDDSSTTTTTKYVKSTVDLESGTITTEPTTGTDPEPDPDPDPTPDPEPEPDPTPDPTPTPDPDDDYEEEVDDPASSTGTLTDWDTED
ncbi:MAG: hypothetical protein R3Y39_08720, partial [Rikenellaceae bacterium]